MSEREPIAAPFESRRQLLGFVAVVLALLALPLLLHAVGAPPPRSRLATAASSAGAFAFIRQQVFEERGDIDLLVLGESVTWVGIDTPAVERELSAKLGRPARVLTLGWAWAGHDLPYQVLRELLPRRRVRHVVMRLWPGALPDAPPHPQSHRWMDAARDPVLATLPARDRAIAHGVEVVGGLRNLLSLARDDRTGPTRYAAHLGARPIESALPGQSFRRLELPVPVLDQVVVGQPWPADLTVRAEAPGAYQAGYARAIRDLLAAHRVVVSLLRFPGRDEAGSARVEVSGYLPALFGGGARVLVPRPVQLFQGLTPADLDALYYNDGFHFSANGARFFTRAILPALLAPHPTGHAD